MAPPKSYAEIVQGARRVYPAPAPALPVLPPSTSSSTVVEVDDAEADAQLRSQPQPAVGPRSTSRSYASAVKGSHSPPPQQQQQQQQRQPTPPPLSKSRSPSPVVMENQSAPASLPEEGAYAHLWDDPVDHDVVVVCGEKRWRVHRHVLVGMSEGWMEKYLPPETGDGKPVLWNLDPAAWNPGRLEAILRFMYIEEYEGGDYDPREPLATDCMMHNVAHYIAGAAVMCRPMMDYALSRIEEGTDEIVQLLPTLRQAQLDSFEYGIRMALINMYAENDQWLIRALRIVMGKLMAACFHIILQSPAWTTKFEKLWGNLRARVVADHKWLYEGKMLEKNAVIMQGFENVRINWTRYRREGWNPSDDHMLPHDRAMAMPEPAPQPSPSTPPRKKKVSKAIPIVSPGGTVAPRPSAAPRGRGRGRGGPSGLVEPAPQPARGKGKQNKKAQGPEKPAAATTEEAGPSSTVKATPSPTLGATNEGGPSYAVAREDPFAPNQTDIDYWAKYAFQSSYPLPDLGSPPQIGPQARRPSSPTRPSSASSALSAAAEPFLPGGPLHSAESSARKRSSSIVQTDAHTSTDYLESPGRLADLYGIDEDDLEQHKDKGKGKEIAGSPTPGSPFSQGEDIGAQSEQQESTGKMTLDLASLDIGKNEDEATRPCASLSHGSQSENDI